MKLTQKQQAILDSYAYQNPIDFLNLVPNRYESLFPKPQSEWVVGELVIFKADLISDFKVYRYANRSQTFFQVLYHQNIVNIKIFNRAYLKVKDYQENLVIVGHVQENNDVVARSITNQELITQVGIFPIYPLKNSIKQYEIRRLMVKILKENTIENQVPESFISRYRLMSREDALNQIHKPKSMKHLLAAQRTLKYEELLRFQLHNALNAYDTRNGISKYIDKNLLKTRIQKLPYSLTADQIISLEDINQDLTSSQKMYRLLQGDVGSGKTIVAMLSAMSVIDNGYQVAFMVPTEILLNQHVETLKKLFPEVRFAVLSGSTELSNNALDKIADGSIDFVLGTHAMFQDRVCFHNLGYVIIDEQHRFGVSQRQSMIDKGQNVDVLMLSATPIPRSLASSIYFDLQVSTIASYPKHRKKTQTFFIKENSLRSILDTLKDKLAQKEQIYVVCPSIEESKRLKTRNVLDIYESLKEPFQDFNLAYIHGKMSPEDKEKVMLDFYNQKIDILVSTTIIEVGIDVPNANTIVIYNAEMFGLSTLHQLRGRVGRADKAGLCFVLSSMENEEVVQRLNLFTETQDGFKLSLLDLKTRGMGDLLGERQSGLPNFIFSNLEQDEKILKQAKLDAIEIANDLDNADFYRIVKSTQVD